MAKGGTSVVNGSQNAKQEKQVPAKCNCRNTYNLESVLTRADIFFSRCNMLPELAWTLKRGEEIVATTPDGVAIRGIVHGLNSGGASREQYIQEGFSILEAIRRQHDGPTVLMQLPDGNLVPWRPDYVERVTRPYGIICCICGITVLVDIHQRALTTGILENVDKNIAAMITQSCCGSHI